MDYFLRAIIISLTALCVSIPLTASGGSSEVTDPVLLEVRSLYHDYSSRHPDIPDITVEAFPSLKEESSVVLVDVRTPEERAVSTIPGAITDEEFEADREEYRGAVIVVYCTIGVRSGRSTKKLVRRGYDAYNLAGGVLAWAHAGGGFLDSHGNRTDRVHVYGEKWSLLPPGYSPVW
jgi:sodium/bile acid cotransporter 7